MKPSAEGAGVYQDTHTSAPGRVPTVDQQRVTEARQRVEAAKAELDRLQHAYIDAITDAHRSGVTLGTIAGWLGVTRQRVHALIRNTQEPRR